MPRLRVEALFFVKSLIKYSRSLSDPTAVIQGEGVIAMGKIFRKIVKKIAEDVIVRAICDLLKQLFLDND